MFVAGNVRVDAGRQADENCLKAIYLLHMERGRAYANELSERLGSSLSATYSAMHRLTEQGYIHPLKAKKTGRRADSQPIIMTPTGEANAEKLIKKHQQIQRWLICLGVPEEEADEEACHWEHSVTDKTIESINKHVQMATRIHGGDKDAVKEIRAMVRTMSDRSKQTPGNAMLELMDQVGGIEGIRRKCRLSERAGGDDQLEETLNLIDSLGGMDCMMRERDMLIDLQNMVRRHGGIDEIMGTLALIDSLGGEVKLMKLKVLADTMGGMDTLLNVIRREQKIWSGIFLQKETK